MCTPITQVIHACIAWLAFDLVDKKPGWLKILKIIRNFPQLGGSRTNTAGATVTSFLDIVENFWQHMFFKLFRWLALITVVNVWIHTPTLLLVVVFWLFLLVMVRPNASSSSSRGVLFACHLDSDNHHCQYCFRQFRAALGCCKLRRKKDFKRLYSASYFLDNHSEFAFTKHALSSRTKRRYSRRPVRPCNRGDNFIDTISWRNKKKYQRSLCTHTGNCHGKLCLAEPHQLKVCIAELLHNTWRLGWDFLLCWMLLYWVLSAVLLWDIFII